MKQADRLVRNPIRLAVGVLLGAVVWIVSSYGVSRLVGASNFPQSLDEIARGYDPQGWWWAGAVAGVVTALVVAGARRAAAVALTAGLALGAGLLAWEVVWAGVQGFE